MGRGLDVVLLPEVSFLPDRDAVEFFGSLSHIKPTFSYDNERNDAKRCWGCLSLTVWAMENLRKATEHYSNELQRSSRNNLCTGWGHALACSRPENGTRFYLATLFLF